MDHAHGFRNTTVSFAFVLALMALTGPGYGQSVRTPIAPSPYTTTVNCPDANALVVNITPNTLPAGWTSTHTQLELRVVEALPSQNPPGKQSLNCHYKAKDCAGCTGGADTLVLHRIVEQGSCMNSIPGQPKKSFLCKPGTVN
jgi:hypothetical protein